MRDEISVEDMAYDLAEYDFIHHWPSHSMDAIVHEWIALARWDPSEVRHCWMDLHGRLNEEK